LALKLPIVLVQAPPVSDRALDLAALFARIDLTKFRFRIGCVFIATGVVLFFLGHMIIITRYFTADFTERSWLLTKILLVLGAAFAGKEVIESLVNGVKSAFGAKG